MQAIFTRHKPDSHTTRCKQYLHVISLIHTQLDANNIFMS